MSEHQDTMPFVKGSETSRDAARAIKPRAASLRAKVFEAIHNAGLHGLTDEEIQDQLGMSGSTERPRRRELQVAGLIVESGNERRTKSGRTAVVWTKAWTSQ